MGESKLEELVPE